MIMIINRWFFPIIATVLLSVFYILDETSISPIGLTLVTILTFTGVAVTERLDRIIKNQEENQNG